LRGRRAAGFRLSVHVQDDLLIGSRYREMVPRCRSYEGFALQRSTAGPGLEQQTVIAAFEKAKAASRILAGLVYQYPLALDAGELDIKGERHLSRAVVKMAGPEN
jgi:hypothetical protein